MGQPVPFIASAKWDIPEGGFPDGVKEFAAGTSRLVIDRINARCAYLAQVVLKFYSGGVYRTMVFQNVLRNVHIAPAAYTEVLDVELGDVVVDADTAFTVHAFAERDYGYCSASDATGIEGIMVTGHRL